MHGGKTFPFQWTLVQGLGLTAQTFVVQLRPGPGPGGKFQSKTLLFLSYSQDRAAFMKLLSNKLVTDADDLQECLHLKR